MKVLVFDIETSIGQGVHGSDPKDHSNDYFTVIYGNHPDTVKIRHNVDGFKRRLPEKFFDDIDIVVGHNLSFDLGYIWQTSCFQAYIKRGGKVWDTQLTEYFLSAHRHQYASLAELQEKYLGKKIKQDRISRLFKNGFGADKILAAKDRCKRLYAIYERYCLEDGETTLRIFARQYKKAQQNGMLKLIQVHQASLLAIINMQCEGIVIDAQRCEETLRDFRMKSMEFLEKATELVKPLWDERLGTFNINSPKQKSAILFGGEFTIKNKVEGGFFKNGNPKFKFVDEKVYIKGFDLPKTLTNEGKNKGVYTTDAGTILQIYRKAKNETAKEYCRLQKEAMTYHKLASTYLEPFLTLSVDSKLYPNFNTCATVTGRLSSRNPNFQNMPASGPLADAVGSCLIAPEGFECVDIDFSSLEIYVVAMLAQDKQMIADLISGVDFHVKRLSWIPRLSKGKSYDELMHLIKVVEDKEYCGYRKKAKGVSFAKAYGGGAKSLAEANELEVEDVQALFDAEDQVYYRVKEFNDRLFEQLKEREQLSYERDFSHSTRKGKKFKAGIELLPFYNGDVAEYHKDEFRHYGTYKSPLGHVWAFEELGQLTRNGYRRRYSTTETKNFHVQGTAADIMQTATSKVFEYVLQHQDDIKLVRQIHDSLGFYVKKSKRDLHIPKLSSIISDIRKYLKEIFGYQSNLDYKVEAKTGPNFANLEVYHV